LTAEERESLGVDASRRASMSDSTTNDPQGPSQEDLDAERQALKEETERARKRAEEQVREAEKEGHELW